MISLALALPLLAMMPQTPAPDIQRALNDRSTSARRLASEAIADQGLSVEPWLLKEMKKGASLRQRSLLLSAALMGTESSFAALLERAKKGRKPDEVRAYALLLYGAFHPDAGKEPLRDRQFAASAFERSCYLAGVLTHARDIDPVAWVDFLEKRSSPQERALFTMLLHLRAAATNDTSQDACALSSRWLGSMLMTSHPLPASDLDAFDGLPVSWRTAVYREPARTWQSLEGHSFSGELASRVFALREFLPEHRTRAFISLDKKVHQPQAMAWLWGLAGDLGLDLPLPASDKLLSHEVAGILRLALEDRSSAVSAAYKRLPLARALLNSDRPLIAKWPAYLILALTSDPEDESFLADALEQASSLTRQKIYPIWLFRRQTQMTEDARLALLRRWSVSLGAGSSGYLDQLAPVWVGNLLLGNTDAMTQVLQLATPLSALIPDERDHPRQSALYEDIAEFLFSGLYHFDLP